MENHFTDPEFWNLFDALPLELQTLAVKNYRLLRANPRHPSLHFKQVNSELWSARVGIAHCALAYKIEDGLRWFWIGPHDEYERLIRSSSD